MNQIILIASLLISSFIFSQTGAVVVTNAPTLEAMQSSQLKKSILQLEQVTKQTANSGQSLKLLKDTKKLIDNVNSKITTSEKVYSTLKKQANLLTAVERSRNRLNNLKYIKKNERISYIDLYAESTTRVNALLQSINNLLTSGIFKMNDAERLNYLTAISGDLDKIGSKLKFTERRFTRLNSDRKTLTELLQEK